MKRKILTALLLCGMIFSATACGASSMPTDTAAAAPMAANSTAYFDDGAAYDYEMTAEEAGGYPAESASNSDLRPAEMPEKLIYTANLDMETTDFETAAGNLTALVESCGGYFENSSTGDYGSGYRYANYTIRVPAEQFQSFLDQSGKVCHELWRDVNQQNISETYYDVAGRLETQKIKLDRLQELLSQAVSMEDIITIESAISETEWDIESLSGTLRHYDAQVDYSTIYISVREVYKLSNTKDAPIGLGDRLTSAFSNGWDSFLSDLEELAVALAYGWMWIVVLVVVLIVVIAVIRGRKRAKKAAKEPVPTEETKPTEDDK